MRNFRVFWFCSKNVEKIRFKFENWEKFYRGFPCKKNTLWEFLYKMNRMEFEGNSSIFFSRRSDFFFSWEFFVNWTQIKFNWGFPFIFKGVINKNQKEIHWKINPDQIFKYARKKKERKKKKKRKKDLARTVFQS